MTRTVRLALQLVLALCLLGWQSTSSVSVAVASGWYDSQLLLGHEPHVNIYQFIPCQNLGPRAFHARAEVDAGYKVFKYDRYRVAVPINHTIGRHLEVKIVRSHDKHVVWDW